MTLSRALADSMVNHNAPGLSSMISGSTFLVVGRVLNLQCHRLV